MIPVAKPFIGLRERFAVDRVLRSGQLTQGQEVEQFESEFSRSLVSGLPVVAVNSGTSGQHLGLLALGVGRGDEVIVPSFTFAATANAVALTGAKPVFCDIDPRTFTLSPTHFESLVTSRTRGVMPVHLFGHPADMNKLMQVAQKYGLEVYEDAAQAHGASIDGKLVGTFGEFGMFSLYPTKNMTSGEGGMVSCRSGEVAERVRLLRNQGMKVQYENEVVGFNNRMTDIHAAIGRVQLKRLNYWTSKRQRNAAYLSRHLEGVTTPRQVANTVHVFHQYTIRVPTDRDLFCQALLKEHGVQAGIYYRNPVHRLPSLAKYSRFTDVPETVRASNEVLSLPVHPALRVRELDHIVQAVNRVAKAGG